MDENLYVFFHKIWKMSKHFIDLNLHLIYNFARHLRQKLCQRPNISLCLKNARIILTL